jgi:hypothetical protein
MEMGVLLSVMQNRVIIVAVIQVYVLLFAEMASRQELNSVTMVTK